MKVCAQAMYRLICSLLAGKEPSKGLIELVKSSGFSILRADAQEELCKRRSFLHSDMASRVRSLCDLVLGLEVLQRVGTTFRVARSARVTNQGFRGADGSAFYGSKAGAGLGLLEFGSPVRPQSSLAVRTDLNGASVVHPNGDTAIDAHSADHVDILYTSAPEVIDVQAYFFEADLRKSAASLLIALTSVVTPKEAETPQALGGRRRSHGQSFSGSAPHSPLAYSDTLSPVDHLTPLPRGSTAHLSTSLSTSLLNTSQLEIDEQSILLEVAIAIAPASDDNDDEPPLYETVYCGSCLRFKHVGLAPSSSYLIRCRAASNGVVLEWSPPVEFTTQPGISFTFDPLKCGPDILLRDGKLAASYAGDDNWSTLLGSQPFSAGKVSWEIRVTHSSTAYLFVGVATSEADLNTFLGGCGHGWGFIGEQALYHNRENVKGYGEAFSAGDFIGVYLDFHLGTLSFSRNGKQLGVAFDKICGELYPAVAFYNIGQELEIIPEGFRSSCSQEIFQSSPARMNLHGKLYGEFVCIVK